MDEPRRENLPLLELAPRGPREVMHVGLRAPLDMEIAFFARLDDAAGRPDDDPLRHAGLVQADDVGGGQLELAVRRLDRGEDHRLERPLEGGDKGELGQQHAGRDEQRTEHAVEPLDVLLALERGSTRAASAV